MKIRGSLLLGTAVVLACLPGCESSVSGAPVSIAIIDDATTPGRTYSSIEQVGNTPFREFIAGILSHLLKAPGSGEPRLVPRGQVDGAALVFVRLPVATSGTTELPPAPPARAAASGCRVQSPWFDLTVRADAAPRLQGVFVWSERQILQDLAFLAGQTGDPLAPPQPLPQGTWQELAELYAREALMAPTQSSADETFEDRIPDDILFLFRQAPQSTFAPFEEAARETMGEIAREAVERQVTLATTLIERCTTEGSLLKITDAAQAAQVVSHPE